MAVSSCPPKYPRTSFESEDGPLIPCWTELKVLWLACRGVTKSSTTKCCGKLSDIGLDLEADDVAISSGMIGCSITRGAFLKAIVVNNPTTGA